MTLFILPLVLGIQRLEESFLTVCCSIVGCWSPYAHSFWDSLWHKHIHHRVVDPFSQYALPSPRAAALCCNGCHPSQLAQGRFLPFYQFVGVEPIAKNTLEADTWASLFYVFFCLSVVGVEFHNQQLLLGFASSSFSFVLQQLPISSVHLFPVQAIQLTLFSQQNALFPQNKFRFKWKLWNLFKNQSRGSAFIAQGQIKFCILFIVQIPL